MTTRIKYDFSFTWPVEISGIHLGDLDLEGAAKIVRDREDKDWEVEEWLVGGIRNEAPDGHPQLTWDYLDVNPVFASGQLASIKEAMELELQLMKHRATIDDMLRQMIGKDAAA